MSLNRSTGPTKDLSFADQQELLAFIDKRNWFEGKLEVSSQAIDVLTPSRSRLCLASTPSCTPTSPPTPRALLAMCAPALTNLSGACPIARNSQPGRTRGTRSRTRSTASTMATWSA